jgi:hypothetical protein
MISKVFLFLAATAALSRQSLAFSTAGVSVRPAPSTCILAASDASQTEPQTLNEKQASALRYTVHSHDYQSNFLLPDVENRSTLPVDT